MNIDRGNGLLIIRPAEIPIAAAGVDEEFTRQVAEFIAQYRPALEKLAR